MPEEELEQGEPEREPGDEEDIILPGCKIPADSILNCAVSIAQYFDDEGGMKYAVAYRGEVPLTQFLGLLKIAEMEMIAEARRWQQRHDEDEEAEDVDPD